MCLEVLDFARLCWNESESRACLSYRRQRGRCLLRREIFSDVGKLPNHSLNVHFLATQVELMSFSITSVSLYDNRSNLGIDDLLISMTKRQVTVPNIHSCLCEWIAAMALKTRAVVCNCLPSTHGQTI